MPLFTISLYSVLLVVLLGQQLFSTLSTNLSKIMLHKTLSQENVKAIERQQALYIVSELLSVTSPKQAIEFDDEVKGLSMIPAILRGEHYWRQRKLVEAGYWYRIAAEGEPNPHKQGAILIPPQLKITIDGNLVIDATSRGWKVRRDTIPRAKVIQNQNGKSIFSFFSEQGQQKAAFAWNHPIELTYHHTLVLKAKVKKNTKLLFETVIDGDLKRHFTYIGTGYWEEFVVPVQGNYLKYIYVLLRQSSDTSGDLEHTIEVESLSFLLDEF